MKILVPGKLILSGEHAVVYGQPALAMAVNRYVTVSAARHFLPFVSFDLRDYAYHSRLSFSALQHLKNRIKEKYQRFLQGEFKIRDVLQKPVELAQFALTLFFEMVNIKLTQGIKIRLESDIPIGCGMGSSAATVLGVIHAIAHHLKMDLSQDIFYRLGLAAENMQHGFSSGLDLRVAMQGGCLYMHRENVFPRAVPQQKLYLVNTGIPQTSTGECVSVVAPFFKDSHLGEDFSAVTNTIDLAFQQNNFSQLQQGIHANHRLLNTIGVVPLRVQHFIDEIQTLGGAAKICGAGAVRGNNAGIVLVVIEEESLLQTLCARYAYEYFPAVGETQGVRVVVNE